MLLHISDCGFQRFSIKSAGSRCRNGVPLHKGFGPGFAGLEDRAGFARSHDWNVCGTQVIGEAGIGKSTLLLQAAARFARNGLKVVYISGEESVGQVRRRAKRLGVSEQPVSLAAETSLGPILDALMTEKPDVVIIDSIQTLWTDQLGAAPGTVAQVRACAQELTRFAKKRGACVILVGHVTKDGQIAGPRVVEHMVDAVLFLASNTSRMMTGQALVIDGGVVVTG